MDVKKTAPLVQGHLDNMCGLYSVINAIRWLQRDDEPYLQPTDLFSVVVHEVDKVVAAANVLLEGILPNQLWPVMRKVLQRLQREHGLDIEATRPFFRQPGITAHDAARAIAEDCRANNVAYVVVFWGELNHWSVVNGASAGHFQLFDSCGRRRLRVDQCQMPNEFRAAETRPHILDKAGIMRLTKKIAVDTLITETVVG